MTPSSGEGHGRGPPGRMRPGTRNPSRWKGATPCCLPIVCLIVPVLGLALAPC
jgi:hypothetical protein